MSVRKISSISNAPQLNYNIIEYDNMIFPVWNLTLPSTKKVRHNVFF